MSLSLTTVFVLVNLQSLLVCGTKPSVLLRFIVAAISSLLQPQSSTPGSLRMKTGQAAFTFYSSSLQCLLFEAPGGEVSALSPVAPAPRASSHSCPESLSCWVLACWVPTRRLCSRKTRNTDIFSWAFTLADFYSHLVFNTIYNIVPISSLIIHVLSDGKVWNKYI